jgi:hypothetical protein
MAEPQPASRHLALKAFAYGLAKYIGAVETATECATDAQAPG